jgi:putative methyltransferase (TIGR04325 family)
MPGARSIFRCAIGYMRPFASLAEAQEAIRGVSNGGHENPYNIKLHLDLNQRLRPSDYAALFHLSRFIPDVKSVFDVGGNVGVLYYSYRRYLVLPKDLRWRVYDLPANVAAGQALAVQRRTSQLQFSQSWRDAEGMDVLIASGSLHYLPTPLPDMIGQLQLQPEYILINRTPLQTGSQVATVQDAVEFRIACILYNRNDLVHRFEMLGYELLDIWDVAELSLVMPGYPEHSVPYYSGMLLRRRRAPAPVAAIGPCAVEALDRIV